MANIVYSSVPASITGKTRADRRRAIKREMVVIAWLTANGYSEHNEATIAKILDVARMTDRVLHDEELRSLASEMAATAESA